MVAVNFNHFTMFPPISYVARLQTAVPENRLKLATSALATSRTPASFNRARQSHLWQLTTTRELLLEVQCLSVCVQDLSFALKVPSLIRPKGRSAAQQRVWSLEFRFRHRKQQITATQPLHVVRAFEPRIAVLNLVSRHPSR